VEFGVVMKNKFNARKVEYDGYIFDSIKESERYLILKDLQKKRKIAELFVHPEFILIEKNDKFKPVIYKADFSYVDCSLKYLIEDVKGLRKGAAYSLFKIKQKLMYDRYKIEVIEI